MKIAHTQQGKQGIQGKQVNQGEKALREQDERRKWMENEFGHKKMRVWQNADKLDSILQIMIKKIPAREFNLKDQIDRASNSIGANFVEGYYSDSLAEYIRFCKYAKRSCGELMEHIRRIYRKGLINIDEFSHTDKLAGQTLYLFDRLITSLVRKAKTK